MTEQTQTLDENKLKEIQQLATQKQSIMVASTNLSTVETTEIDETFGQATDFRTLGEKIVAPIDDLVSKTSVVIENDPIMDVSNELAKVNNDVQGVYKEIINTDSAFTKFAKSIPGIGKVVETIDNKIHEARFNLKSVKGKIQTIFDGFDVSYNSLNKSIDMQKEFLKGLEDSIAKVKGYKDYILIKLQEFRNQATQTTDELQKQKYNMFIQSVEYFLNNLDVLIGNLELARKRLLIRLEAAVKLSLSMNSSRPIFQTLLSVAIIETSGQKALDASIKAMNVMGQTIDNLSKDLTDKTIEASKKAEETISKPVLDTQVFVENVKKLKEHFETIEQYREKVHQEAEAERKAFEDATLQLKSIKELKSQDYEHLQQTLSGN